MVPVTIAKAKMLGRHQPPSDDILLDNQSSWRAGAVLRLPEKPPICLEQLPQAEGMTVRELAAIGRYPWHRRADAFWRRGPGKVDEAITLVGLKPLAHRLVDSLSGGERQRTWIAMLVAQDSCYVPAVG
ncbi:ATP-binding cassette domain-containing protein [Salmonella enterica subsp. enterica]|nr:ATP-binding cassette domain-containing protein [Salmonella enterica subsp. enterica]